MRAPARVAFSFLFFLTLGTFPAIAQDKILTLADYGDWNRIRMTTISPDGNWLAFSYEPNDGDATFHVKSLDRETVYTRTNGSGPEFSDDSRWVGFLVRPTEDEAEKLRKQKKPVPAALHLIDLATGDTLVQEDVASFAFANNSGYLAIHRPKSDREAEHDGADLFLSNLATGVMQVIGNVSEYAFDETGSKLAYLVDAASASGNGLYVVDLNNNRTWPVSTAAVRFAKLAWNEDGSAVATLKGEKPEGMLQRSNQLVIASDFEADRPRIVEYDPLADDGFSAAIVLSELRDLEWSTDGSILYLGVKEQESDPDAAVEENAEPKADVDVWHWADERLQSVQMVQERGDRRHTWLAAYQVEGNWLLKLEDDEVRRVTVPEEGRWAVGRNDVAYRMDLTQEGGRADFYRIDLRTGDHSLIVESVRRSMGMSPDGTWFVFLKDGEVLAHHLSSGSLANLSAKAGVDFQNMEFDRVAERPAYGIAGWSSDGSSILLNHRYDIWNVPLRDGEVSNLTVGKGSEEEIRFRVVRLDPDEETIDLEQSVLLSAYGEWTKKSGYYSVRLGRTPEPLLFDDLMIGNVQKAEEADQIVFTQQTFEQFPDLWASDLSFRNPRKVTDANPQLGEYDWGRRVLVDYVDQRGNELQATLALPAGYEEGKQYPMLVYFYEKMSQRHHQFSMPVYDDRPHMSTYASNGYLVLMPDIVFEPGKPGSSALDDVTAAVQEVIDLGYADPDAIGLQGHSWGGYESSFIVTQTDMFAAVVTGAPLTNMFSMYNILYKRSGNVNGAILEWSQGRFGVSPWQDFDLYVSQSPVHHAPNISTPFVILHGIEDGAVDWNQGLEFYTAARRLGKEVILLSYPGEPHHLAKEENQKDFQVRMMEFFNYHLKGDPAPEWVVNGVPFLDKGKRTAVKQVP